MEGPVLMSVDAECWTILRQSSGKVLHTFSPVGSTGPDGHLEMFADQQMCRLGETVHIQVLALPQKPVDKAPAKP